MACGKRIELCHHGRKIACLECVDEGPAEEYALRADRNRLTTEVKRLQAELAAANERAEKAHQVLERFADDLDSGPSTQLLATELRNRWREALRSTPAAKTLRCERCGYCRGEVVCTHCGTPATSSGLSEAPATPAAEPDDAAPRVAQERPGSGRWRYLPTPAADHPLCPVHKTPTVDSKGRPNACGLGACLSEPTPAAPPELLDHVFVPPPNSDHCAARVEILWKPDNSKRHVGCGAPAAAHRRA